jgi:hypothetical protein
MAILLTVEYERRNLLECERWERNSERKQSSQVLVCTFQNCAPEVFVLTPPRAVKSAPIGTLEHPRVEEGVKIIGTSRPPTFITSSCLYRCTTPLISYTISLLGFKKVFIRRLRLF